MLLVVFATWFGLLVGSPVYAEDLSLPAPKGIPVIQILCESRLVPVVEDIAGHLRAEGKVDVRITPGTTTSLLKRLAKEAETTDAILFEGQEALKLLIKSSIVEAKKALPLASDQLVLAVRSGSDAAKDPMNTLRDPANKNLVMCRVDDTLCGIHAQAALKKLGIWEDVSRKAKWVGSSHEAVREVAEGRADIAIAYRSELAAFQFMQAGFTFPSRSYLPLVYFGAPLSHAPNKISAQSFLRFLTSQESASVWTRRGFQPPP